MQAQMLAPAAVLVAWSLIMLMWMAFTRLPAMKKVGSGLGEAKPGGRGQDLEGVIPDRINWKAHNYAHLVEQPTLFYGVGAGEMPTASAVVADLMEIAREIQREGGDGPVPPLSYQAESIRPKASVAPEQVEGRSYFRVSAVDEPGVLSRIAGALGDSGVGIESVIQRRSEEEGLVPVIILTHTTSEDSLRRALEALDGLDCVQAPSVQIRIEEDV